MEKGKGKREKGKGKREKGKENGKGKGEKTIFYNEECKE
jgi:hypothetical protein